MLTELRVRDLAVIGDVTLPLHAGLNVLTGETGAGKSLLVDALALLLGERASAEVVRPGADRAVVEGVIDVASAPAIRAAAEALGVEAPDGVLVIKREVHAEGRSRAWVNGSPTTAGVLSQIGALLVDLHGQHETQSLLQAETQRDLLDAFADAAVERLAVRETHAKWKRLAQREAELRATQEEVRRKADYLRHVVQEITAAAPKIGEDEQIGVEAKRLAHADELARLARDVEQAADGAGLARAAKLVASLERLDGSLARWRELLDGAFANLDELRLAAAEYANGLDGDPARLEDLERRRDVLFRLQQKYGPTLADVLAARDQAARELDLLDTADFDLHALAEQRRAAESEFTRACSALTGKREAAAGRLAQDVDARLPALGMPGGRLEVRRTPLAEPRADGAETVTLYIQLTTGLEARPLGRVASGGELSRLMLALKVVLAAHDAVPTLVFDEVDQGIGGEVGGRVGAALTAVAHGAGAVARQVLVITHLPQIAAHADHHMLVRKASRGGLATSDVAVVTGVEREREIARMLGDADMATAQRHAAELLKTAGVTSAARSETPSRRGSSRSR